MDYERVAIIGLGNPGGKYTGTRHNVGFRVVEALKKSKEFSATDSNLELKKDQKLNSLIGQTHYKQMDVILAQPQTFMNNSGQAVKTIKDKFNLKNNRIWVICDDLDLTIGKIRAREQGSSGGHKGLEDIIAKLDSQKFGRIRLGIKPIEDYQERSKEFKDELEAKDFVLDKFSKKENSILEKVVDKTLDHIFESLEERCLIKTTIEV
jgi:PTH1 family peptidyl-tRNA hydrolase